MAGPWEKFAAPQGDGPWAKFTPPDAPPTVEAKQPEKVSMWDAIKMAAKPDIFNLGDAAYELGGTVTDKTGSPLAGYLTNVAVQSLPTLMGLYGGTAGAPLMEAGSRRIMQSALKPSIADLQNKSAAKAITTMLDDGFNVSKGSLDALKAQIANLNNEIATAIKNSNATVDKNAVASRLGDALKRFEMQVNPASDVNTITKAWTEFLSHPLLAGKNAMPVQTAQAMKQGTYSALGNKAFGELKGAEIEAQKALARGLREEIAAAVPAVAPLNAKDAALINARDLIERRVLQHSNNNLLGLGAISPSKPGLAAWMIDRSPLAKSLIARGLYKGREAIPGGIGAALGALSAQPTGVLNQSQPLSEQEIAGILSRVQ